MKNKVRVLIAICCSAAASSAVALDTSKPFLCAVAQVNECLDGLGCEQVLPEVVNAPTFIWVDVKKKLIRINQDTGGSGIATVTRLSGRHILQGTEEIDSKAPSNAAWTLSIEDDTGRFVGAAALQQASITLFGACTELEYD
jgi:hypothetical protein